MQNMDLFVNVSHKPSSEANSRFGGKNTSAAGSSVMEKYQKQRNHHLPLGGMIGERAAKYLTIYENSNDDGTGGGNPTQPLLQKQKQQSAFRRGARMSLDMGD